MPFARPGMTWSDPKLMARVRARPDLVAIAILLVVSLAIRLRFLSRPLHGDEMISFSNMVLGRDFTGILFGPFDSNSHLLNSLIMKAVYLVAGESPALMRLPNLVFALLAIVLLYWFGSREFGRVVGYSAALILSLHPAMVLYSVSTRGYAGMVLFTLVSSILLLQVLIEFSWRRLFLCSLTGFLACAFHLFSVNVLIAQAVLVVLVIAWPEKGGSESLRVRALRFGPVILGPAIALALLFAISLPSMRHGFGAGSDFFFQSAFPVALVNFLGGCRYRTDPDVFSIMLLALTAAGFFGLSKNRMLGFYAGLMFLSPLSLYVLSFFAPVFTLHPRFFVFLLPFSCLLFLVGLQHAARLGSTRTGDGRLGSGWVAAATCLCVVVAAVFFARIEVPRGNRALIRAQKAVGEYVDSHPETRLLTNDTGFVRVRLRQERNMDRIRPALGIIAINEYLEQHPDGAVDYIYVPQKRYTAADLIHYKGEVPPEVKYQRDERLRNFLNDNATLELDLAPMLQIYTLRPPSG